MEPQNRPEQIVIQPQQNLQGEVQYTNIVQQPQIVYIDLKYNPENNFRYWSYGVIAVGISIYFGFGILFFESDFGPFIDNSLCCLSFSIAFFLDAAFYKGKSEWQTSTGQSSTGSIVGMVFDIIFGIIALFYAVFLLIFIGEI